MTTIFMEPLNAKIERRTIVFIDTSAMVALLITSDSMHREARRLMSELTEKEVRIVTTEMIFFELANGLSAVRYREVAINLISQLRAMENLQFIWSSNELFDKAVDLYRNRPDKDWSLTDCASFVVMKERNISMAFTSDKHFEQAGFVRLLEVLES